MVSPEATLSDVQRRLEEMRRDTRESFATIGKRLDDMPTTNTMSLHLQTVQVQFDAIRDDVRRYESRHDADVRRLDSDVKALEDDVKISKRFGITSLIMVAALIVSVVALLQTGSGSLG